MPTKYGRIAHELREAISNGEYEPGDTLPAIPDLMERYQVARDTVRDAIGLLTNEGLVIPTRGRGTVVREVDPVALRFTASAAARTWEEQTAGAGKDEVVSVQWVTADRDIAARLGIEVSSRVLRRQRHFTKGHGVAQVSEQWIPETVVNAVKEAGGGDLASDSRPDTSRTLFDLMAEAGLAPTETTEHIGTRMPDPIERETMEVPPGVPVLVTLRVTRANGGEAVETTTAVGAGDRMSAEFTVALDY